MKDFLFRGGTGVGFFRDDNWARILGVLVSVLSLLRSTWMDKVSASPEKCSLSSRSRRAEVDTMVDWNRSVIEEFRANKGRVAAFAHQPLLLLTHIGRKTGKKRTNPVAYFRDGERFVIVASKGGAPTNPDWYYNLLANPRVTIEAGTEQFEVTAKKADAAERDRLWAMVTATNPGFKEYEKKTSRTIPLIILTPSPS